MDLAEPEKRLVVELLADGLPIALLRSERFSAACVSAHGGDGCHGFGYALPEAVARRANVLEARLANQGTLIGMVENRGSGLEGYGSSEPYGEVHWSSGLRISGWVAERGEDPRLSVIQCHFEGQIVSSTRCSGWAMLPVPGASRPVRTFELDLPVWFADGRVRSIDVSTSNGKALLGSPCLVIAFPDGLESFIETAASIESEKLRARHSDRLLPQSLPFTDLEDWLLRFPPTIGRLTRPHKVRVLLIGEYDVEATLASLREDAGVDWEVAVLPTQGSQADFRHSAMVQAVEAQVRDCDLAVFTLSGSCFESGALQNLCAAAGANPDASIFYSDLMLRQDAKRWPLALPAFDEELLLERGFCALFFAVRPKRLRLLPQVVTSLYALLFHVLDDGKQTTPLHIPELLITLPELQSDQLAITFKQALADDERGSSLTSMTVMEGRWEMPTIRVGRRPRDERLSVIIATRNDGDRLRHTLATVEKQLGREGEIIIVDNDSTSAESLECLAEASSRGHNVVHRTGWFSLPKMLNAGVEASRGDNLLTLRVGSIAADGDWLSELQGRLAAERVGAVGGLVTWSMGLVRHAGYVLGPAMNAVRRFADQVAVEDVYGGLLTAAHECSAVSFDCMLTRRHVFESVGGFDAVSFPLRYADVDYCQKLRAKAYRVLFSPHARVTCDTPDIRWEHETIAAAEERERSLLSRRWGIAPGCDPFYSPWLNRDHPPFSALGWPPLPKEPRHPRRPVEQRTPAGF